MGDNQLTFPLVHLFVDFPEVYTFGLLKLRLTQIEPKQASSYEQEA